MQVLKYLNRLGARRSTHIKHGMVRFDLKQCHRHHGDFLLSEYPATLDAIDQEAVKLLELVVLAKLVPAQLFEAITNVRHRVPFDKLRKFLAF